VGVDHDYVRVINRPLNGCAGADGHTWGRIAVPALIRKGGVQYQARFSVDAWFRSGGFKNGKEQIFRLRMDYRAGGFTLLAAYATFRMYKDSFHPQIPFSKPSERRRNSRLCFRNTSSLETSFPPFPQQYDQAGYARDLFIIEERDGQFN
jgi:hypothetical protein